MSQPLLNASQPQAFPAVGQPPRKLGLYELTGPDGSRHYVSAEDGDAAALQEAGEMLFGGGPALAQGGVPSKSRLGKYEVTGPDGAKTIFVAPDEEALKHGVLKFYDKPRGNTAPAAPRPDRLIEFEGRRIQVPADATDDEIKAILSAPAGSASNSVQRIQAPNGDMVEFPAGMTDDAMAAAAWPRYGAAHRQGRSVAECAGRPAPGSGRDACGAARRGRSGDGRVLKTRLEQ